MEFLKKGNEITDSLISPKNIKHRFLAFSKQKRKRYSHGSCFLSPFFIHELLIIACRKAPATEKCMVLCRETISVIVFKSYFLIMLKRCFTTVLVFLLFHFYEDIIFFHPFALFDYLSLHSLYCLCSWSSAGSALFSPQKFYDSPTER